MFKTWLALVVILTATSALAYILMQQNLRMAANDPQIQMSEDISSALSVGEKPESLVSSQKVDISRSLAPFVIIYDNNKKVVISSATLDNQTPGIPGGVLDYVDKNGEDRVTWQPREGVRIAAVITKYSGNNSGYVLAGRSLRESESRDSNNLLMTAVAWLSAIVAVTIIMIVPWKKLKLL